jgi:hypothetical protein
MISQILRFLRIFSLKARALYCDCSEWQEVIPMVWKIRVRLINIVPFKMLIGLI